MKSRLIEPVDKGCKLPPPGWWCSRDAGHEGPCAARPDSKTCSHYWSTWFLTVGQKLDYKICYMCSMRVFRGTHK